MFLRHTLGLSTAAIALALGGAASAQTADQDEVETGDSVAVLDSVTVTAQRRAENLQNVPIATTAFTGDRLEKLGVTQSNELAFSTPNLYINGSAENAAKITLRGVGSNDFIPTANPGVGTYVDEVFNGMSSAQTFQLFDLERVEVLRGPQGTLYGKNSTGGTINYITKKPDFDGYSGSLSASAGNFDAFSAEGAINTPIADNLAARSSFVVRSRSGYIDNLVREEDGRFLDAWAARVLLAWQPTDTIDVLFNVHGGRSDGDSAHRQQIGTSPAGGGVDGLGYFAPRDPFVNENDLDTFDIAESFGASVRADVDLGWATLTSITAHERIIRDIDDDVDDSPFAVTHNRFTNDSDFISQELRLTGDGDRFNWVVGTQYYDETHDVEYDLRFFECAVDGSCPVPLPAVFGTTVDLDLDQTNTSWAVFGDTTYDVTDKLSVTGGLRFTYEERELTDTSLISPVIDPGGPSPLFPGFDTFMISRDWDNISGRLVLEYQAAEDILLYGSVATGFRAGNFNGGSFARIEQLEMPVDPEEILNYEAGFKSELFNNRMRLNGAVFFSDFSDLQVAVFEDSQQFLRNAADAEIFGAELELEAALTESLFARFALGYLDTEYVDFIETADDPSTPTVDETRDLSGNTLVNSPEWTISGSLEYSQPISDVWEFEAGVDARYQSEVFFTPFNDLITTNLQQDGYSLVNLRFGFNNLADDWSIEAFMLNAAEEEYATDGNGIGAPFFFDLVNYGAPRTWGVRASANF